LVDAGDLKSSGRKATQVRILSRASSWLSGSAVRPPEKCSEPLAVLESPCGDLQRPATVQPEVGSRQGTHHGLDRVPRDVPRSGDQGLGRGRTPPTRTDVGRGERKGRRLSWLTRPSAPVAMTVRASCMVATVSDLGGVWRVQEGCRDRFRFGVALALASPTATDSLKPVSVPRLSPKVSCCDGRGVERTLPRFGVVTRCHGSRRAPAPRSPRAPPQRPRPAGPPVLRRTAAR
jgi:hypothetical protein